MKRTMIALFVGAMMLASASIASAEVVVGGNIVSRYDVWKNFNLNSKVDSFSTINFFNSRVMLNVDAKITEGLEGFIEIETGTDVWGLDPGTAGVAPTAAALASVGNVPGYLNSPALGNNMSIRQAWINFTVPGTGGKMGVKVGHQPLALGHGIWLDTSRYGSEAILVYAKPTDSLLIAGAYVQGSQDLPVALTGYRGGANNRIGNTITGLGNNVVGAGAPVNAFKDDADFYALLANYTWMPNNTAGINFTYVNDKASLPALGVSQAGIWATNTALVMDGVIGSVTYKGEVDWLYVNTNELFGVDTEKDYLVNAWAAMLGASVKAGPANIGLEVAYGTGNDDSDPNAFYNPGNAAVGQRGSGMDKAYYTPYNSTSYNYAFIYNDKVGQGPLGSGGGAGFGDGYAGFGLANTGYVKLSLGVSPMDKMKAGLDVLYLRASETMIEGQSRDLGWEVDANVSYKLYDNCTLSLTGGMFAPGAWYAFQGHANVPAAADGLREGLTDEADQGSPFRRDVAWGMQTTLALKF